jgi:intracellular sulfur oxidation DsrE/DsrF family protein
VFSVCKDPLDLIIVIDMTQYWSGQFPTLIRCVKALVSQLNVGPNTTHIGVVTFNQAANLEFGLVQYLTSQDIQNALDRIVATDGTTLNQQVCATTIIKIKMFKKQIAVGVTIK